MLRRHRLAPCSLLPAPFLYIHSKASVSATDPKRETVYVYIYTIHMPFSAWDQIGSDWGSGRTGMDVCVCVCVWVWFFTWFRFFFIYDI